MCFRLLPAEHQRQRRAEVGLSQWSRILEYPVGTAAFIVPFTGDVTKWKIKFASSKDYSLVKLDQEVYIGIAVPLKLTTSV